MDKLVALRGKDYPINDYITVHSPLLDEIYSLGWDRYISTIARFCATPSDCKVMLDDMGIDYSQLDEYEFFLMTYKWYSDEEKRVLKLVFGDFDITEFDVHTRSEFNDVVLALDKNTIFDKATYIKVTTYLRTINNLEKRVDKPGNEHTKKYLIDKERRALKRRKRKKDNDNSLYDLIVALINTPEFKYDYETVWQLTLYQFYRSLRQIQKVKEFGFVMNGVYAGTVDTSKLNMNNIHWLKTAD